jgi:hypothetical protein
MQTKTYNIYTFDELDEKAKEKARDWYRQNYSDYPFLSEDMEEEAKQLLEDAGIITDDFKVYYSLSYCQGDGAMIEIKGKWKTYDVRVTQSGMYYHYNSKNIYLQDSETGEDVEESIEDEFNQIYIDICQKLEKFGYQHMEHDDSDDNVDENILASEYTFLLDGTRHN